MTSSATRTVYAAKIPGLTGGDYSLNVRSSSPVLDERRAPYGEITLVAVLPESSVLSQITPFSTQRLQIDVTHSWRTPVRAGQTRSFDFLLHERTIDHEAGTLTIKGVTDEGLLIDRRNVSSTLTRTYGLSVKTACEFALTAIGATLEAGAVDAALTSKALEPTRTNLALNPSGVATTGYWGGANSTLSRLTGLAITGLPGVTTAIRGTQVAAVTGGLYNTSDTTAPYAPVTPGLAYTYSVWVRSSVAKTVALNVQYAGGPAASSGPVVALAANTWTQLSLTVTAPVGATRAGPYIYSTVAWAAGNTLDATGLLIEQASSVGSYFDGSTTDPGLYAFAFTGTAHASASTKTNLPNSDSTIWRPGQSLYDWLAPILQAAGRRLFCDERRKWRLVDASYLVDGQVTVSAGFNAKRGTDTMSRQRSEDGVPLWFDHVAVHYSWTDAAGARQEAWDFASAGSVKGSTLELSTPWPGPGAAAAVLARAAGRGRVQDLVALVDYLATPGMSVVSTLPGTPIQSGVVSSVAWNWGDDTDEMTVGTRGLTTTPADAWVLDSGPWSTAGGTWNAPT